LNEWIVKVLISVKVYIGFLVSDTKFYK
jgi:hypothetical protein